MSDMHAPNNLPNLLAFAFTVFSPLDDPPPNYFTFFIHCFCNRLLLSRRTAFNLCPTFDYNVIREFPFSEPSLSFNQE